MISRRGVETRRIWITDFWFDAFSLRRCVSAGKMFFQGPDRQDTSQSDTVAAEFIIKTLHAATARHHGFAEIFTFDRHQTLAAPSLGLLPRDRP